MTLDAAEKVAVDEIFRVFQCLQERGETKSTSEYKLKNVVVGPDDGLSVCRVMLQFFGLFSTARVIKNKSEERESNIRKCYSKSSSIFEILT